VIKEKCILKGYILYKLKSLLKSHFLRLCEFLSIKNSESHFWIARNISFLRDKLIFVKQILCINIEGKFDEGEMEFFNNSCNHNS